MICSPVVLPVRFTLMFTDPVLCKSRIPYPRMTMLPVEYTDEQILEAAQPLIEPWRASATSVKHRGTPSMNFARYDRLQP